MRNPDTPCLSRALWPPDHRYTADSGQTTIKLTTETRDRLGYLGSDTYQDTIIEALDLLEEREFWAQADRAAAWRASLPADERAEIERREATLDATLQGLR